MFFPQPSLDLGSPLAAPGGLGNPIPNGAGEASGNNLFPSATLSAAPATPQPCGNGDPFRSAGGDVSSLFSDAATPNLSIEPQGTSTTSSSAVPAQSSPFAPTASAPAGSTSSFPSGSANAAPATPQPCGNGDPFRPSAGGDVSSLFSDAATPNLSIEPQGASTTSSSAVPAQSSPFAPTASAPAGSTSSFPSGSVNAAPATP
eukprot:symbB.v1.2.026375.t1/scaffold2630.1/size74437/1